MREIDEALPEFMKDLMEFKRQEYDLNRSILQIAANNRYTPFFDRILSQLAVQLRTGTPMNETTVDPRSRLGRIVLFILGQMAYSGGGTVDTFHQLSVFTERVFEMKRNAVAEMRPYLFMSFASPVLLAFGVAFISGVIGSFGSLVGSRTLRPPRDEPGHRCRHPPAEGSLQPADRRLIGGPRDNQREDGGLHRQKHAEGVDEHRDRDRGDLLADAAQHGLAAAHVAASGLRVLSRQDPAWQ